MNHELFLQMEARLGELEARLAIMDLEACYAETWDAGDGEAWASLYTDDGAFEMAPAGQEERRVVKGARALAEFCREVDQFYKGLHFMHLPVLRIAGDTATARLHFQWIGLFNQGERYFGQRHCDGYYDVSYRKQNGVWLIAHRLEKAISGAITDSYDTYRSVLNREG